MKSIKYHLLTVTVFLGSAFALQAADPAVPKDYPLEKCPVSRETYGEGGMKAYKVSHDGTDVWLCCKSCKGDFDKDPAKYAKAVKDAAAKK